MRKILVFMALCVILVVSGITADDYVTPKEAYTMIEESDNTYILDVAPQKNGNG